MKAFASSTSTMLPFFVALTILPSTLAQFFDHSIALQPPPPPQLQAIAFPTGLGTTALGSLETQHAAFIQPQPVKQSIAHHAVLRNAADEERLPSELRNDFYKNPRLAEALAKESWFTPGEERVVEREAEKIPRDRVVKLLKNAGLARRR